MVSWFKNAEAIAEQEVKQIVVAAVEEVTPKPVSLVRKEPKKKVLPDFIDTLYCVVTGTKTGWAYQVKSDDPRRYVTRSHYSHSKKKYVPEKVSMISSWGIDYQTDDYACSESTARYKAKDFLMAYVASYVRMHTDPIIVRLNND